MIKLEIFTPAIAGKVAPLTINDNNQVTSTLNGMLTAVTNTAQTIAPLPKHNHSEAASTSAIVRDSAIYVSPTILEAPNKKQLLIKYDALIEEDQIDRLKRRGEADREQDIEQLILLAKACNTNDLDSIMAIYTALMSNNNVPFKEDGTIDHQRIYLFRAHPIRELPAGNPYIDGVIGNQVNASAIIFDMDRKCQRSAGLSNEKQNEHRGNSIH